MASGRPAGTTGRNTATVATSRDKTCEMPSPTIVFPLEVSVPAM